MHLGRDRLHHGLTGRLRIRRARIGNVESTCPDIDGNEQFETGEKSVIISETYYFQRRSGATPAYYGWMYSFPEEDLFKCGPANRSLQIKNTGGYTSYSVSYSFNFHGEFEFDDYLAIYTSETTSSEHMVVESPLGVLGEMDLQEYDYVYSRDFYGTKNRVGITAWRSIIDGACSNNTICQIFGLDVKMQAHSWDCGERFAFGGFFPDRCQSSLVREEEIFGIKASCKTGINGHATDPRTIGRNPSFEGALRTGIDAIKALANAPASGDLEYYYLQMKILRTPLDP